MTYGRNDGPRDWRRDRNFDDRDPRMGDDHRRGWFDRASDEVASWFGDDDAQRRRTRDERFEGEDDGYVRSSRPYGTQGFRSPETYRGDAPRYRDEGYRRPYRGGRPMSRFQDDRYTPTSWDDSDARETGFARGATYGAGAAATSGGLHDRSYSDWRSRQIDSFDRDYDDYRRENESRFESEFASWREKRGEKRGLLTSVTEHMDVVGSDGTHVGTVDKVRGDQIILTKSDSSDGQHHRVPCSMVDRIEGNQVILEQSAADATSRLQSDTKRALFESDRDRDNGPHMLNRSFSGTY